jgi:hypothetical protein
VTAWRHGPVISGCAAAPDPPPRVLAPEAVKLGILAVPAPAGGHGVSLQAAGGRPREQGRARARTAGCAQQLRPSPRDLPHRLPSVPGSGGQPRQGTRLVIRSPPGRLAAGGSGASAATIACAIC